MRSLVVFLIIITLNSCGLIAKLILPVDQIELYNNRNEVEEILENRVVDLVDVDYVIGYRDTSYVQNTNDSLLYSQRFKIYNSKGSPLKIPEHCNQNEFLLSKQFNPFNLSVTDGMTFQELVSSLKDKDYNYIKLSTTDSFDYYVAIDWCTFAGKFQKELVKNINSKFNEKKIKYLFINKDLISSDGLLFINESNFTF